MKRKTSIDKISANSVSLAGEFAVLSKLALFGYDANMTLGNTKGIDILVSDPNTNKMYQLEVKTCLDKREKSETNSKLFGKFAFSWMMGEKHETLSRKELWYCFVSICKKDCKQRFFIVPSKVVSDYVKIQHEYWLNCDSKHKDSKVREFRLGFKDMNYNINTPIVERYEDNWGFM